MPVDELKIDRSFVSRAFGIGHDDGLGHLQAEQFSGHAMNGQRARHPADEGKVEQVGGGDVHRNWY